MNIIIKNTSIINEYVSENDLLYHMNGCRADSVNIAVVVDVLMLINTDIMVGVDIHK